MLGVFSNNIKTEKAEDNPGEHLNDLWLGDDYLDATPKA